MSDRGRVQWRSLVVSGVALFATACTWPGLTLDAYPVGETDPRNLYPIAVESRLATLRLPAYGGPQLSVTQIRRLDAFVAQYLSRGQGPLRVRVAQDARAMGEWIVDYATEHGLRDYEVVLRVGEAEADEVQLSFETAVARAPECPDWSKESSHDATNTPHSNFGCATQHDIARMLADPADIQRPRHWGRHDVQRSNVVIQGFRAGEATVTERTEAERATLSDVSE